MKPLVVIVEDDRIISELVEFNLINEGYDVRAFRSGSVMLGEIRSISNVSAFVLDIMLPDMDGFDICRSIRKIPSLEHIPVIMLTAMGSEKDKVKALDIGADDYITKPFGVREFLARVNAHVRRFLRSVGADARTVYDSGKEMNETGKSTGVIEIARIRIDDDRHRVYKDGKEVDVTHREYELLKFMMRNRGVAFTRDELLNHVWGYEYAGETRTVDVHIRQLRRKIEQDDANPIIIETVRGRGYRFSEDSTC